MLKQKNQTAYLAASADGATQIGLLVVVYEAIARDLLRAGEAAERRDITGRCSASNRALQLLGHVESWADCLDDPRLITSLKSLYQSWRNEIVRLQVRGDQGSFERLSETVMSVRAAWQVKEQLILRNQSRPLSTSAPYRTCAPETPVEYAVSGWHA